MGASKKIKKILIDKEMTHEDLSKVINKDVQQIRNALYRDVFGYKTVEAWLDALGYDIVFRERGTGRIVD